jgi:hypothetical protein
MSSIASRKWTVARFFRDVHLAATGACCNAGAESAGLARMLLVSAVLTTVWRCILIQIDQESQIGVSVSDANSGKSSVIVTLNALKSTELHLTPLQARALAMELIQAVHRSEVRGSLGANPYRRRAESDNIAPFENPSWA